MMGIKRNTRKVYAGSVGIGGDAPVSVQSMTNVDTKDLSALESQFRDLEAAGAELIRVALYDRECAAMVPEIIRLARVPVVGDVHFDAEIAVIAAENGISKIRINPGNVGGENKIRRIVDSAKHAGIPIRVGANSGSLPPGSPSEGAEALVSAALNQVRILERHGFSDIVLSLKSSNVRDSVAAARIVSRSVQYPLHLGITEAGTERRAVIRSAVGIGALLLDGIGDTIRVSISGDPVREPEAALSILAACGLRTPSVDIISCPTCARCGIDVERLADQVRELVAGRFQGPLTLAIMGCAVNGPGEARHADAGLAGSPGGAIVFRKGQIVRRVPRGEALGALMEVIEQIQGV